MPKFKRNRSNLLIEPANRLTETPNTDIKSIVLETIGEIVGLITIFLVGWIAWIVF